MKCRMLVSAGALLALASGTALALPPILDRVPTGMAVVIVIPSIEQLGKDAAKIGEMVGSAEALNPDVILSQFPGADKINQKGPVAIVIAELPSPPKEGAKGGMGREKEEPKGVALFQSDDYDGFIKALGGTPTGGVDKVSADGKDLFAKKVDGGFVAIGDDKATVEKMTFATGQNAAHAKAAGARAGTLSDSSDLTIFVDVAKARPAIDEGLKGMEQQMEDMAAMGGQAPNTAAMKWFLDNVLKDATTATFTLDLSDAGVSLNMVSAFKADSRMAKIGALKGGAAGLTARLPLGPYLAALAADFTSPELRKMLSEIPQQADGVGAKVQAASNKLMFEKSTGAAMMVGVNPGGPMAGLLARSVSYTFTSDAKGFLDATRTEVGKAYEEDKLGKATYKADAADVNGVKVESYDIKMTPNPDVPQQAMQIMFGMAGGPSGYVTPMDGGVVTTIGKSSDLMGAAMKAFGKGEGTIGADKPLAATAAMMPKDRFAEIFIGTKGLLDSALPTISMFTGTPLNVQVPEDVAPIGLAIAPADGSIQASIVIPSSVLKTGAAVAKAFQEAQQQNEQPADPMEPAPEKKDSTKPKF